MKANIPESTNKRIVIIGGGFAGLQLATDLVKQDVQVVLIDKQNFHQFQPLYYQVATAGLEPSSIVFPYRKLFQGKKNFHFRLATVLSIQTDLNVVNTSVGPVEYDELVLCIGATTNFFGNHELEKNSLGMKTISEALDIRNKLLLSFEYALTATDDRESQAFLNVVIVGGGPTGVELAGTIAEMKKHILPKDFPEMDFSKMKISLFEGSPRLLNGMTDKSGEKSLKYLQNLGVDVQLNTVIESFDGQTVLTGKGEKIQSRNLIWAAGVVANEVDGLDTDVKGRGNRLKVDQYNLVNGYKNVYALGDVAFMTSDKNFENGHPQVAQVAIQQAKNLGKNITKNKNDWKAFSYKDLGSMATIGRNKAVVDLPSKHFSGFPAWVVWMLVHLRSILGVKNKFLVFIDWVWNYFTFNLSLRLIIKGKEKEVN